MRVSSGQFLKSTFVRPGVLAASLLLAVAAAGAPGAAESPEEGDVEGFLRKESGKLSGASVRKAKVEEPERGRWRVSVAEIPLPRRVWIPDVDRHAAAAYTEAVREDAKRLTLSGRHGQAIEQLEQLSVVEEGASDHVLKDMVDYSYRAADYERSLTTLRKMLEVNPDDPEVLCNTAAVLLQQGKVAEAMGLLERIKVWEVTKPALVAAVFFNRACAYSGLGHKEKAVQAVYAAYKAHPRALSLWLTDGQLDGIRGDPRMGILENAAQEMRKALPPTPLKGELGLKNPPEVWVQAQKPGGDRLRLHGW